MYEREFFIGDIGSGGGRPAERAEWGGRGQKRLGNASKQMKEGGEKQEKKNGRMKERPREMETRAGTHWPFQ